MATVPIQKKPDNFFFVPASLPETALVEITPRIAKKLLDLTDTNIQRKLNNSNVKTLQKQLEEGKWEFNGDAVRQDVNGNISDGMHRLTACVRSKIAFVTLFVKGLPTEAIHTIDRGRGRTLAEILTIKKGSKIKYPQKIASCATFVYDFSKGRYSIAARGGRSGEGKHKAMDPTDFLNWVEENPNIFGFVEDNMKVLNNGDRLVNAKTFLGLKWVLDSVDKERSDRFFQLLSDGVGLTKGHPVHALRRKIIRHKTAMEALNQKRFTARQLLFCLIATWNAYIENKSLDRIYIPSKLPKIEGYQYSQAA